MMSAELFLPAGCPYMFLFDGTIQRDLLSYSLVSQYTLNHGRWYHINHNSLVSSVLSIYLFKFLSSADHTECFVHMFHSRKTFCLYSALQPQMEIQQKEHRGTPTAADLLHPAGAIDHEGAIHQLFKVQSLHYGMWKWAQITTPYVMERI